MHLVLFRLLLILLPTQLGLHFWPAWAMVLGRRMDFLSPTIYLTDILIFLMFVFWRPKKIFGQRPISLWLTIFVFAAANIFFAINKFVSAYMWFKVFEYIFLGIYVSNTKPKFSHTIFYLSIGVLYSSLIAIGQFFAQHSLGLWILGERAFTVDTPGIARFYFERLLLRSYATFPHPNVLGAYLAILLLLIVTQIKKHKVFYLITMVFGIIALILTFSRSAWVAAGLGVVFLSVKKKYFIPAVIAAALIIILTLRSFGIADESVVVREELNNSAISMFLQSPVVGKGLGNFLVELPNNLVSRQIYFLQPVHNIFLLVLAETGILGFALFIWLLWQSRKKWVVLLIIFLGFFDHYFLTLQQGQLMLTILLSSTIIL